MRPVRRTGTAGVVVAFLVHAVVLGVLLFVQPPKAPREERRPPVRVRLVRREPPPPPAPEPEPKPEPRPEPEPEPEPEPAPEPAPEPEPKPKARPEPKPEPRRKPAPRPERRPRPKPDEPPVAEPPKEQAARPDEPAPDPKRPRRFSVRMDATVPGGGVAVPTAPEGGGGYAVGDPEGDPGGEGLARGPAPPREGTPEGTGETAGRYQATEVTVLPKLLRQPSEADMRRNYPARAKEEGREADVLLELLVSADGRVQRVRVMRAAGHGFDAAARKLARQMRFRPGKRGGKAVSVWIPWTYKFRLDG